MLAKGLLLAAVATVACSEMARAQTVETNTFAEINAMASLWESDTIQVTSLVNTQYPSFIGGTWQYLVPHTSLAADGDIHINGAVDSSGTGTTGNNAGESPIISEVINATSNQLAYLDAFTDGQGKAVGIFRFWTEHTGERHFEIHPMLGLYKWDTNSSAFVFDTDYHANIVSDPNGRTHSATTLKFVFDGSDRMIATVMPDNDHLIFTWQSPSVNYVQYDGVAMSGLTNDSVSQYFWFHPTNPSFTNVPAVVGRCRIITNTLAATLAAGLVSNQTVTVNALTRTDMLVVSNTIAGMTSGQSTNITRPAELITLGITNLGPIPSVASFSASPTNGFAPLAVTFTDTSTGSISTWSWTFGDGGTTNLATNSVLYTYNTAGVYSVTEIVNGPGGSSTNTLANYITVLTPPPVASFTANPTNGFAPLVVTFTNTSSGTITNQFWDFGDLTTTNTVDPTIDHTYNTNGSYTVQLTVSGPGGVSSNAQTGYIVVAAPCNFPLSATNASFADAGGIGTVTVTPYTNACAWTATSNDSWIQIPGDSFSATGSAVVVYTVLPNTTTTSSRTGTMTVAGQTFTVTESGDVSPPTVALTTSGSGIVSNVIALSATATDNVAVAKVEFYREGTVLLGTRTTPPYNLNFDTTTVGDGSVCFTAKAYDPAGNVGSSAAACVTVDNQPPSAPTGLTAEGVSTTEISLTWTAATDAGSGVAFYTVFRDGTQIAATPSTTYTDTGLTLDTEHCYKVVATDHAGRVSPPSAEGCGQTFTTVAALAGTYNGLVIQTNAPSFASSGQLTLVLGNTGVFAASLRLGRERISFKGQFSASGNSAGSVDAGKLGTLQVALHLDLAGADQITGTVSSGTFNSQLLAGRAAFSRANPCPLAGSYTAVLQPSTNNDPNIPQGFGYGTLTVATTGNARMTGLLGDGTRLSISAPLSKQGLWPLYESLYRGEGAAIGWVTIGTNRLVNATLDWFRPSVPSASFFPAGFNTVVTLDGNKYVRPVNFIPSFSGNGQLTLGGGNLEADIVKDVYINPKGIVSFAFVNDEKVQMKLNPATGQFSGSFKHPTLDKTITFKGLVLQIDGNGAGYFVGTSETGFAVIQRLP